MGGGRGTGLDFGATYGSGRLPIKFSVEFNSGEDAIGDNGRGYIPIEEKPSAKSELISQATTDQVKGLLVEELYRSDRGIGDGGTADAIRHEPATGEKVGGKSHIKKGRERLKQIEKILKKDPNHPDRKLLEKLRDVLEDALGDDR